MMNFKSFMESAHDAERRARYADLERKARKKGAKRKSESAATFTQSQRDKMAERGQQASDTKTFHAQKNAERMSHTKKSSSLSDLHRPFYSATKGAVKGTVKGAVKLAKKVMQRDSN